MSRVTPREFAIQVTRKLQEAGFQAFWAGGCVRDQLLGLEPKDYDVATDATPEEIREHFGHRRTLPLGAAFGVITVIGPKSAGNVEVATFRSDGPYSDGRRPDEVIYSTAEHDAQRRDFTINGLFYDPLTDDVIDFVNGQRDLETGVIRGIGDPGQRIAEDKLRMLRAVRFAATFGFDIEPATLDAISNHAHEITMVSAERIAAELRRMLAHPNRRLAVELLDRTGLMERIFPELKDLFADSSARTLTLRILDDLPMSRFPLSVAALLLTVHDGVRHLQKIGRRLRLSNEEVDRAAWILKSQDSLYDAHRKQWSEVQPVLVHSQAPAALALLETQLNARGESIDSIGFCQEQLARPPEELNPPAFLDGESLKSLGLEPGPMFSSILHKVRAAQLDGEITSFDEAIEFARKMGS